MEVISISLVDQGDNTSDEKKQSSFRDQAPLSGR